MIADPGDFEAKVTFNKDLNAFVIAPVNSTNSKDYVVLNVNGKKMSDDYSKRNLESFKDFLNSGEAFTVNTRGGDTFFFIYNSKGDYYQLHRDTRDANDLGYISEKQHSKKYEKEKNKSGGQMSGFLTEEPPKAKAAKEIVVNVPPEKKQKKIAS
ncbi:MAG: hypothetical protein NTV88_02605 [Candidatus Micrarchaeota archaeon]|nr:hypothetical protein [Candidatus Micrarchaeota archaeon]